MIPTLLLAGQFETLNKRVRFKSRPLKQIKEVMEKESNFLDQGGAWITYVPEVALIRK